MLADSFPIMVMYLSPKCTESVSMLNWNVGMVGHDRLYSNHSVRDLVRLALSPRLCAEEGTARLVQKILEAV